MGNKQQFLKFLTGYLGERFSTYEEFKEYLFEEVLKKDGYDNTMELLLETFEDYLKFKDDEEYEDINLDYYDDGF